MAKYQGVHIRVSRCDPDRDTRTETVADASNLLVFLLSLDFLDELGEKTSVQLSKSECKDDEWRCPYGDSPRIDDRLTNGEDTRQTS